MPERRLADVRPTGRASSGGERVGAATADRARSDRSPSVRGVGGVGSPLCCDRGPIPYRSDEDPAAARSRRRWTSASASPRTSASFDGDRPARIHRTESDGTPSHSASRRRTLSFASPPIAFARHRTVQTFRHTSQATESVGAPGRTRTARRTDPVPASAFIPFEGAERKGSPGDRSRPAESVRSGLPDHQGVQERVVTFRGQVEVAAPGRGGVPVLVGVDVGVPVRRDLVRVRRGEGPVDEPLG